MSAGMPQRPPNGARPPPRGVQRPEAAPEEPLPAPPPGYTIARDSVGKPRAERLLCEQGYTGTRGGRGATLVLLGRTYLRHERVWAAPSVTVVHAAPGGGRTYVPVRREAIDDVIRALKVAQVEIAEELAR